MLASSSQAYRWQRFTFRNRLIGERVHAHPNRKVIQIVQELAELSELVERYALFLGLSVQQTVQVVVVLIRILKNTSRVSDSGA